MIYTIIEVILLILFVLSCVYCSDLPVIAGAEIFINNHDSLLYSVGTGIIASYIFYIIQVVLPRFYERRKKLPIACQKLYEIEQHMEKVGGLLQGESITEMESLTTSKVMGYLSKTDVFEMGSRYYVRNGKMLSVWKSLKRYDELIQDAADEIISNQYLPTRGAMLIIDLKKSKLHEKIIFWDELQPGEYEHSCNGKENEKKTGYIAYNKERLAADFSLCVEDYRRTYRQIAAYHKRILKWIILSR